jgi:hypothetical protein
MNGAPLGLKFSGYDVRPARKDDLTACNALCQSVHGHHRSGELDGAITAGTACVVEHLGKITAYATGVAFFAHAVAETNQGLKALIGAARTSQAADFCSQPAMGTCSAGAWKTACAWCTRRP